MQHHNEGTAAAIDIGSNSTEALVARYESDHLNILKDESTMLRLGEDVKATGEISQEKRDEELKLLRKYYDLAQGQGADPILAIATEASRNARNRDAFVEEIWRTIGLSVNIIPGTIEAALTYHGATYGTDIPPDAGVLDVGGGSTELVTAKERKITWLTSLPIGSGWLHDQFLFSDPPTQEERDKAQRFLRDYLQELHIPQAPQSIMATGSSAKSLLKIAQRALELDPQHDRLTRKDVLACQDLLHTLTANDVVERYGLKRERAVIMPGGAMLILAMMDFLHLDEISVSQHGVREGVLLAYARYGERWLEHPEVQLDQSRLAAAPKLPKKFTREHGQQETFAQTGRDELPKRAKKFLEWEEEVLKDNDVEAVHKMRVASRRLRAAMDAYKPACKPKPFKKDYRTVKQAADLLGQARDTDVMIQHAQEQLTQVPPEEQAGLQWFINRLKDYRQQRQNHLEDFLQNLDEKTFEQKVDACIPKGGPTHG